MNEFAIYRAFRRSPGAPIEILRCPRGHDRIEYLYKGELHLWCMECDRFALPGLKIDNQVRKYVSG